MRRVLSVVLFAALLVPMVGCDHMPWSKDKDEKPKSTTMKSDVKASTAAPAPAAAPAKH